MAFAIKPAFINYAMIVLILGFALWLYLRNYISTRAIANKIRY
jgi:hypothetical protein